MDAKLGDGKSTYPQLSGKLCWNKIALFINDILNIKVGYLFLNDFMSSPHSPN